MQEPIHLIVANPKFFHYLSLMRTPVMLLAAIVLLLILSSPTYWVLADDSKELNIDLPSALLDDIFDDLPFEQRRQALREEVELNPLRPPSSNDPQRYNLLIR